MGGNEVATLYGYTLGYKSWYGVRSQAIIGHTPDPTGQPRLREETKRSVTPHLSTMGPCFKLFAILVALLATAVFVLPPDILKGLSSNVQLGNWQLQLTVTGFCFSGLPQKLLQPERGLGSILYKGLQAHP